MVGGMPASPPVDSRADRVVEGAVAIALLAAFVFRQPLVVPAIGLIVAIGAAVGPRGNALHVAFATVVTPRLPAPIETVDATTIRVQDLVITVLLAVASLAFLLDIDSGGWLAALLGAGVALLAATTGFHVAAELRTRLRRSREQ
jgi:hypothetical protein